VTSETSEIAAAASAGIVGLVIHPMQLVRVAQFLC